MYTTGSGTLFSLLMVGTWPSPRDVAKGETSLFDLAYIYKRAMFSYG